MSDILNVMETPISGENIIKKDYHSYVYYIQSFKNNDSKGKYKIHQWRKLSNHQANEYCVAFLFGEIRYEINGVEINRTRYLRISSTIKNYVSLNKFESNMMKNAVWMFLKSNLSSFLIFIYP